MFMNQNIFNMKEKIPLYIIGAFVLFLLVSALSGCRTKSETEYVAVHDTLRVVKTDTVRLLSHEKSTDTVRVETEKVVTLSVSGDTMKVVEARDRWRDRWHSKTDTIYKSKTDTVYQTKEAEKEKTTVVTKRAWWERLGVFVAILAMCWVVVVAIKKGM